MNSRKRVFLWIGIGLCLLAVIGLIRFGNIFAFFLIFPWLSDKITEAMGLNQQLANFLAIPAAIYLAVSISLMLSFKAAKRYTGIMMFILALSGWYVAMFVVTGDALFDPQGRAQKCVAKDPRGSYEYEDCSRKVHRFYGTEVVPLTKEIIAVMSAQKNGLSSFSRVTPNRSMRFFTPDGAPLIWYYQYPDGRLELFDQPILHPQRRVALNPINSQVASQLLDYLENQRLDMIVLDNSSPPKPDGKSGPAEKSAVGSVEAGSKTETKDFKELRSLMEALKKRALR